MYIDICVSTRVCCVQTDLNGMVLTYCTMRDVWQRLKQVAQVEQRMAEVEEFNRVSYTGLTFRSHCELLY